MSRITVADCRRVVGLYYKIPKDVMVSATRKRKIARPRQMAMTLAREFTDASLPQIGHHFGGRDHTTAIHAERRIRDLEAWKPEVAEAMAHFRRVLTAFETQEAAE